MRDAAHAINPSLQFLSVVYYATYTPDFVNTYAPYIDGFIFPYRDDPFLDNHLLDSPPHSSTTSRACSTRSASRSS